MSRKIEVRLDQEYVHVVEDGRTLSPAARVTMTAAELAIMVRDHALASHQAGAQATAQPAFDAGVKYAAKAYAEAGVKAGAEYVLANTRVRRSIERDPDGKVIGSVETREPLPSTAQPAEKPARKPMGFHPR